MMEKEREVLIEEVSEEYKRTLNKIKSLISITKKAQRALKH